MMNPSKPIMSVLILAASVSGASASQDWDAERHQVAAQIAASEEGKLQQQRRLQQRLQARQEALNADTGQQHQLRWQKREQERLGVSIQASNSPGHTTMSGKRPR